MKNRLRFIKRVIYRFKKRYGVPVSYYQILTHTTDPSSGVKVTTYTRVNIRKAVVLRAREFRAFVYDLAYISANKDFTTGGYFDPEDRKIILDADDISNLSKLTLDDYIIFQNEKYEVKEVFEFEENCAYILLVRKVRGSPTVRIEEIISPLILSQTATSITQDQLERSVNSELNLTQELVEVT